MNPYTGQNFIGFFLTFFKRLILILTGQVPLASDEIQLVVLTGIAISSALVGTFLVLRRMTMLANSLSHTILLGIVLAFISSREAFLNSGSGTLNIQLMLVAALVMGFVTAFLTEFLTKAARLQEDASTGIVFTSLFALGVILVTVATRDAHIGAEVVMGNVDALHFDDISLAGLILALNVGLIALFFKEYQITTFDPKLATSLGISTVFFNYLLMAQVSTTVVAAFRAVGVLMVLAFITGPVLTARLVTHSLKSLLLLASAIGVAASFIGVALARHLLSVYDLPLTTGGLVVCVILALYLLVLMVTRIRVMLLKNKWKSA